MISNYMYVEPPYFIDRFDPHVFKRSRENRKKFRVYNTDYPILSTFRYVYLISEKQKSYYHQDLPLLYHITRFHRETVAWETHARYLLPLKVSQMDMVTLYILIKKQFLNKNNLLLNNKVLELLWTILPCLILLTIAVPSFFYLYTAEETSDTFLTVKVIGNQWFWSYDYTQLAVFNEANNNNLEIDNFIIDSYMEPEDYLDKKRGASRLLEADNFLLLPINVHIKLLISSSDVLHSFCVPSLGLKVDAVPGRLNQLDVFIHRTGIFYGQCSEICGIGHGFMPICLYAISYLNFLIGTL
jgi:cytochrome c oxidase subunit 2